MITNTTFCEIEDLEKVIGLTHNEFQKNGFNLDNCDTVIIIKEN